MTLWETCGSFLVAMPICSLLRRSRFSKQGYLPIVGLSE